MQLLVGSGSTVVDSNGGVALCQRTDCSTGLFECSTGNLHHLILISIHVDVGQRTFYDGIVADFGSRQLALQRTLGLLHLYVARIGTSHYIDVTIELGLLLQLFVQRSVLNPAAARSVLNPYRRIAVSRNASHLSISQRHLGVSSCFQSVESSNVGTFRILQGGQGYGAGILGSQRNDDFGDIGCSTLAEAYAVSIAGPRHTLDGATAGRQLVDVAVASGCKLDVSNGRALRRTESERGVLRICHQILTTVGICINLRGCRTGSHLQRHIANSKSLVVDITFHIGQRRTDILTDACAGEVEGCGGSLRHLRQVVNGKHLVPRTSPGNEAQLSRGRTQLLGSLGHIVGSQRQIDMLALG